MNENAVCCATGKITAPAVLNGISDRMQETEEVLAEIISVLEGPIDRNATQEKKSPQNFRQALDVAERESEVVFHMALQIKAHFCGE